MKWSWRMGQVAGIGIFVHWTFLILIGLILASYLAAGSGLTAALQGIALVLAVFGCVILHELGHALCARRFGIRTLDITLLPIGGVARLERMPDDPHQELWVALAGPAVNVVIAAGLFLSIHIMHGLAATFDVAVVNGDFVTQLMWTNVMLVAFNLLPAFPMDGGRVLRALLARRLDYVRATRIAARAGQFMTIALGILGFVLSNWFMFMIALFVYVGAEQEARMVETHALLKDAHTRTAMMTRFRALSPHATLRDAAQELLAGAQHDFPVIDEGRLVGVLQRATLIEALGQTGPRVMIESVMRRDCPQVDEAETLEDCFEKMHHAGCSSLPVVRDDHVVGVVTLESIGDWMMVRSALERTHSPVVEELLEV